MFKKGDILQFNSEHKEEGVMKVHFVDDGSKTVHVSFIENHPYVGSEFFYVVKQKWVVKDESYLRKKKLKKLVEKCKIS